MTKLRMATIEATLIVTGIVGMWTEDDASTGCRHRPEPLRLRHRRAGAMSTDLAPPRTYGRSKAA